MKTNYLLSSLCLTPLALTAPVSHTTTTVTLVAGKSVFRPGHQIATWIEEVQHALVNTQFSKHIAEESVPSVTLDAERPLTTAELLALSDDNKAQATQPIIPTEPKKSHRPKPANKDGTKKISVGALVVPSSAQIGALNNIFGPETSPYLIPGQYVASQRADVLIVVLILACVLVVVAMESWEVICSLLTNGIFSRRGPIRLDGDNVVMDMENGEGIVDDESDNHDDDDDCNAPFGGFRNDFSEEKGLRLPEKVDEKAAWI